MWYEFCFHVGKVEHFSVKSCMKGCQVYNSIANEKQTITGLNFSMCRQSCNVSGKLGGWQIS